MVHPLFGAAVALVPKILLYICLDLIQYQDYSVPGTKWRFETDICFTLLLDTIVASVSMFVCGKKVVLDFV